MAEFYLNGQGQTGLRWTLDIQKGAPRFILTDQIEGRKFERETSADVLKLLGRGLGDDKNSTA